MRQYLDLTTWILLFALAPLTILILLSQNTIPGDLFYPVKRGMESVVLAAASVNPSTRVAFRTDLTERRFKEAQSLLFIKADITAFSDFVTEVSTTQQDLSNFSNQQDKIQLSEKLIAKIDQYQNQLTQAQNQVQIAQQSVSQNVAFQITPMPLPSSGFTPSVHPEGQATPVQFTPVATSAPVQSTPSSVINVQPTPQSPQPVQTMQPTQQPAAPSTPAPTIQPQAVSTIANNPIKAEEVKQEITRTHENLEKIKEKVKEQRDDAEIKQKFKEEQKRSQEESKRRGENGNNDH